VRTKLDKIICLLILFFLTCNAVYSQQAFQLSLGGSKEDNAYDVVDAGNNQFYVLSTTNSFGAGGYDI
jgi:hypothetical protein